MSKQGTVRKNDLVNATALVLGVMHYWRIGVTGNFTKKKKKRKTFNVLKKTNLAWVNSKFHCTSNTVPVNQRTLRVIVLQL